jgi:hypothetical protein
MSVPSSRVAAIARTLAVDAGTVAVLRAFAGSGCRALLLKGPTLQRELRSDGRRREYNDTDILVAPASLERGGQILAASGYALVSDDRDAPHNFEPHAQVWERSDGHRVDLHWRVAGIGATPPAAWEVLSGGAQRVTVGGVEGECLSRAGIAMLVGLHAAQSGRTKAKPLHDLERAVAVLDRETWEAAARLAASLDAVEALAAGLRLAPAGERLAAELELAPTSSARLRLTADTPPEGALDVLRVIEAGDLRTKARAVRAAVLPPAGHMRATYPVARRPRGGLAAAYGVRALAKAARLPAAIAAVRRSRRAP